MGTKFITISIEIMRNKDLTPNQKFILAEIEQLSSLDNGCLATNRHFSELTGISKSGVSNTISDLLKKGYIEIDYIESIKNNGRMITVASIEEGIHSTIEPKRNIQANVQSNEINNKKVYSKKLQEWLDYKKERKEKLVQATIYSLEKQQSEDPILFATKVDNSIACGYRGLFAPNNYGGSKQSKQNEIIDEVFKSNSQNEYIDLEIE